MAEIVASVGATGRDYSTLQAAYDDIDTLAGGSDLGVETDNIILECHDDATFTENVIFDGLTTTAEYNVTIRRASTGRPLWAPASGTAFSIQDDHLIFEEIDITSVGDVWDNYAILFGGWSNHPQGVQFHRCVIDSAVGDLAYNLIMLTHANNGTASHPIVFSDCEISHCQSNAIWLFNPYSDGGYEIEMHLRLNNVTFADVNNALLYRISNAGSTFNVVLKNTLAVGVAGGDFEPDGTVNGTLVTTGSTNNFGAHGTLPGLGTPNPITGTDNTSPGAGDWAIVTDATNWADLSLVDDPDNDVIGAGIGPSADADIADTDFAGNARSGATTEPGCYAIASAGGISGTGSATTDDATTVGTGEVALTAAGSSTTDDATTAGTGELPIEGAGAATLDDASTSGSGDLEVTGAGEATTEDASTSGAGALPISASGATTTEDSLTSGTGLLPVSAAGAASLDDATTAGDGELPLAGTGAATTDDATTSGTGEFRGPNTAAGSATTDDATTAGLGELPIVGSGATTIEGATTAGAARGEALTGITGEYSLPSRAYVGRSTRPPHSYEGSHSISARYKGRHSPGHKYTGILTS